MPNHVTNVLDITGDRIQLKKLSQTIESKNEDGEFFIDFNSTVPMPKELDVESTSDVKMIPIYEANIKKYGYKDWYDFHCTQWGTKWGAYDCSNPEDSPKGGTRYRFDTAWSPPVQWIVTTSKQFPRLKFTDWWKDEGGPCGQFTIKNGKILKDERTSEHDWFMEFDSDYRDEYEFITEDKYEDVLEEYSDLNYEWQYYSMETEFIKRLKKEDLPRFVGREWQCNESQDLFESRLKGDADDKLRKTAKKVRRVQ
jgi:hypothetical protein